MSPLTLLDDRPPVITAWTLVPSSVDGDITIQWEWSKLDPRQNPNPSIDHDKFLHNWLRPWDKLVTQIWYKSVVRERLAKYVNYKASFLFLFLFLFFPNDSPTEVTRRPILTHNGSTYVESRKDVPFWGPHDGGSHLGGQIPQKPFIKGAWSDNPNQVREK